ncbi:hypothetical protein H1R20_g16066, partial [Candolleomyces eurysporus]
MYSEQELDATKLSTERFANETVVTGNGTEADTAVFTIQLTEKPPPMSPEEHYKWLTAIRGLTITTTWGRSKPNIPDRWCAICQGHNHLTDSCAYPATTNWKAPTLVKQHFSHGSASPGCAQLHVY